VEHKSVTEVDSRQSNEGASNMFYQDDRLDQLMQDEDELMTTD